MVWWLKSMPAGCPCVVRVSVGAVELSIRRDGTTWVVTADGWGSREFTAGTLASELPDWVSRMGAELTTK